MPQETLLGLFHAPGKRGEEKMQNKRLRNMLFLTILGVVSFVLMYLLELPILPAAPYLKYDLSEVVAIFAGLVFGPLAGSVVVLVKSVLFFLSGKNTTGWVGLLASVLAGLSLVLGSTVLYRLRKKPLWLYLGIPVGIAALTLVMCFFNYIFLLGSYGIPADQRGGLILAAILPFNLIKGAISTVLGVAVFRLLKTRMEKLLDKQ